MKKRWAGALLSVKCCCFVQNHCERVTQFWTSPSERRRRKKTFWPSGNFLVSTFLMLFHSTWCVVGLKHSNGSLSLQLMQKFVNLSCI